MRNGIIGLGFAGDARVLEGHAFIVEAAVSVGGRDMKQGINVHRFANRIPLLFEVCSYMPFIICKRPGMAWHYLPTCEDQLFRGYFYNLHRGLPQSFTN